MFFILIVKSPPINVIAKEKKRGHIKTIILIWLQATQHFNVNGVRISKSLQGVAWSEKKKPIKKVTEYHFNG